MRRPIIVLLSIYNLFFFVVQFASPKVALLQEWKIRLAEHPLMLFFLEFLGVAVLISHMIIEWNDEDTRSSKKRLFYAAIFACLLVIKVIIRFVDGMMAPQ
jgi:glycerol uptake facilitator-like aquaporin